MKSQPNCFNFATLSFGFDTCLSRFGGLGETKQTMTKQQQAIIDTFTKLKGWEDILHAVMNHCQVLPNFNLTAQNKLTRCKSDTHLDVAFNNGGLFVRAYSNSRLIDGYLRLMTAGLIIDEFSTPYIGDDWNAHMELAGINRHMRPEQLDGINEAVERINQTLTRFGALKVA